jgi:hypothetical protein
MLLPRFVGPSEVVLCSGLICAVANLFAFSSASIQWVLFNTVISLGMLAAPVFSGYQIKRRGWRITRHPPN